MDRKRKVSEEYFHRLPERFNCAQAILKGFQQELNIPEDTVTAYKAWGGGRAENGICGALYAIKNLVDDNEKTILEEEFRKEFGTVYCRELKAAKKMCLSCVNYADKLLQKSKGIQD